MIGWVDPCCLSVVMQIPRLVLVGIIAGSNYEEVTAITVIHPVSGLVESDG